VDSCLSSTTVPKMLLNINTQRKTITYAGCITQMQFFLLLIVLDIFQLTMMSYDCFVAICHPLHYTVIMNTELCVLLVLVSCLVSVLYSMMQSLIVTYVLLCPLRNTLFL
jgi:olfactory receptor